MDTEADLQFRPRTGKAASAPLLPEVEAYLQLLMVIFLMNSKRYKEVPRMQWACLASPMGLWGEMSSSERLTGDSGSPSLQARCGSAHL